MIVVDASVAIKWFVSGEPLEFAGRWKLSGYDALYVALASLAGGEWLTADVRAARRVGNKDLVALLGER